MPLSMAFEGLQIIFLRGANASLRIYKKKGIEKGMQKVIENEVERNEEGSEFCLREPFLIEGARHRTCIHHTTIRGAVAQYTRGNMRTPSKRLIFGKRNFLTLHVNLSSASVCCPQRPRVFCGLQAASCKERTMHTLACRRDFCPAVSYADYMYQCIYPTSPLG